MFSVVATKNKRNSKQLLTVVPSSWVANKSIYWPPTGLVTQSKNPESVPDKTTWKMSRARILGQAESYAEAENLLAEFQNLTESEWTDDTELPVPPKPKKGKFESKSYTLKVETEGSSLSDLVEEVVEKSTANVTTAEVPQEDPVTNELVPEDSASTTLQPGQVIRLPDGTIATIITSDVDGTVEVQPVNPPCCDIRILANRLDQIEQKIVEKMEQQIEEKIEPLAHIPKQMETVLQFVANIDKFLTVRSKTEPQSRSDENFSECENITIEEKKDLLHLEGKLKDFEFAAKLLRYYESVYNLSGKRDGKDFFRKFMRSTVPPHILLGYSWTGQTRSETPNESFQKSFPNFIQFVRKLVKKSDFLSTDESTNFAFSDFLRQKKTEIRRFSKKPGATIAEATALRQTDNESPATSGDEDDFPGTETEN